MVIVILNTVTPAQAGAQGFALCTALDSGLRRNDGFIVIRGRTL